MKAWRGVLLTCSVALCLAGTAWREAEGSTDRYEETVSVTIGVPLWPSDQFTEPITLSDNAYLDYLLERRNIEVKFEWHTNRANYDAKVRAAIASDALPDILFLNDQSLLDFLLARDMVEDLTAAYHTEASEYIKAFYQSFGDRAFASSTRDGRIMAVPNLVGDYQFGLLWVRMDWLDALGLPVPQTLQECIDTARAFIRHDMAGSGETLGIVAQSALYGQYNTSFLLDPIINTLDAYPGSWLVEADGRLVYGSIQPQMKEALSLLRALYAEGLLDAEFAVRGEDDVARLLLDGRAGMCFGPWYLSDKNISNAVALDPNARWVPVLAPLSDDGMLHPIEQNPNSAWMVVRKGYAHPEVIWILLDAHWQGARGFDQDFYAIKRAYEEAGILIGNPYGTGRLLCQWSDAVTREGKMIAEAVKTRDSSSLIPEMEYFYSNCISWLDDGDAFGWRYYASRLLASVAVGDEARIASRATAYPETTDTMRTHWESLQALEQSVFLRIILGELDIASFDTFVEDWLAAGGAQVTREVNGLL